MSELPTTAGFVSFVGRPNVGKSTLMNALVGEHLAITSPKPQTTRRAIRGIVQRDRAQLIIVDTPGLHRPRTLLGERLNATVESTLGDVDVIGFCVPANEPIGPGDRFIAERLRSFPRAQHLAILTKTELASSSQVIDQLAQLDTLGDWEAVVPVSAQAGTQLDDLSDVLFGLLPESPLLYDVATSTDETQDARIAELVRESALHGAREELPHSIAVLVEDREVDESGTEVIHVSIVVERDSQKGLVIGSGGSRLKMIRQHAQRAIRHMLQEPVKIQLRVKVMPNWQKDPKYLGRLGF